MHQKIQFLLLLLVCTGLFGSAKAQNYVTIPDPNFLLALQEILPADVFNEAGEMNADHEEVVNRYDLDVIDRDIQSLEGIQYFVYLGVLNCGVNRIISLPDLPKSLQYLNCVDNQLISLLGLPESLQELYCSNNELISLPDLPESLLRLNCVGNQLISLSDLSESLQELDCSNNELISLSELPKSLEYLDCDNNQLISLPDLPELLQFLSAAHNCFSTIPDRPEWIAASNFTVSPNWEDCLITGPVSESEN